MDNGEIFVKRMTEAFQSQCTVRMGPDNRFVDLVFDLPPQGNTERIVLAYDKLKLIEGQIRDTDYYVSYFSIGGNMKNACALFCIYRKD